MRSNGRRRVLLTLRLLIGLVAAGLAVWLGLVAFIVIKEKNESILAELNKVYNSKGWKILEKIRKIKRGKK